MMSLAVRVALVLVLASMLVVAEPTYYTKPHCHPVTVTVTKVSTVVKEVPVYKTVVQLKETTVTETETTTETIKIIEKTHPVPQPYTKTYAYGR